MKSVRIALADALQPQGQRGRYHLHRVEVVAVARRPQQGRFLNHVGRPLPTYPGVGISQHAGVDQGVERGQPVGVAK